MISCSKVRILKLDGYKSKFLLVVFKIKIVDFSQKVKLIQNISILGKIHE